MKVESFKAYNPKAVMKFNLEERIAESLSNIDKTLCHVNEIDAGLLTRFIDAFQERLREVIGDTSIPGSNAVLSELVQDLNYLITYPNLTSLGIGYVFFQLEVPVELDNLDREIEVFSFNHIREKERLRYYVVKACIDILGEEKGIELWKSIVSLMLRDEKIEFEEMMKQKEASGERKTTMVERSDESIKQWIENGFGDFTRVIFDEYKILYKFDRCMTPEVLKELNDPDVAYLCSCYIGDAPNYNFGRQFLKRTQTLHHGSFCDELYYDPQVHNDPESPSLEFTKKLGHI